MYVRHAIHRLALAIVLVASCAQVSAQSYPEHPVKIITPFAAGGPADIYARFIGARLQEALGQTFVVDNRPGAGSVIGTDAAAKSTPDGYTLLLMSNAQTVNESLVPNKPYALMRDFVPVAPVNYSDLVLVVNPSVAANNLGDLIKLAKSKPGKLNYASSGPGTPYHMAGELFKSMAGLDIVHVPYKGVTPALTDLLGGQVQLVFAVVPAALPLMQTNKLRALGVTSAKRTSLAPELPTIAESLPGFEVIGWYGVLAPTGTPADVVTRLNAAVIAALKIPELRERFVALGADPLGTTPQVFSHFIRTELVKWGKAVKDSGARVE